MELTLALLVISILLSFGIKSCISGIDIAKRDNTKDKISTLKMLILETFCKTSKLLKEKEIKPQLRKDGWNNSIKIIYALNIESENPCSLNRTQLSLKLPSGEEIENLIAVFISPAENGVIDSVILKKRVEVKNDDIWDYITLAELKKRCCVERELKILTKHLPSIVEGETYSVTIVIKGGIPPYRCRIESTDTKVESFFNHHLSSGNGTFAYCRLSFTADDLADLKRTPLDSKREFRIKLEVKDSSNPPFLTLREYVISIRGRRN